MKIMNKKTGEVIDLSSEKEAPKSREAQTEERIKSRGTIQDSVKKLGSSDSLVKKAIATADIADAPFSAIESGIANVGLKVQKEGLPLNKEMAMAGPMGNAKDIGATIKEAVLGLTLQKQGQYGDIMKNAGYNPILADTAGIVLHLSPAKVYSEVAKTFGAISKMSDQGLMKAGDNLLNAVNQAKTAAGVKVSQEFAKGADNVPVDGLKFIEDVSKLPGPVMKKAEVAFGDMSDFANGLTVGKLREFKRFLGKIRPSSYGQAERGLQETLDVKDLNTVYGNIKKRMVETLSSGMKKNEVEYLMKLEDAYSEVANAGRFIRKSINDPILRKPTRVGEFTKSISNQFDSSSRNALNTIKKTSREAMARINSAMKEIESFNRSQIAKSVASHVAKAAVYGGIAGGIGGRILKGVQDNSSN